MKVLVLAPPMGAFGGIQRYTTTLLQALKELVGEGNVRCLAMPDVGNSAGSSRASARSKLGFIVSALWAGMRWRADLVICAHLALGPIAWLLAKITLRPYWVFVYGIEAWAPLPFAKRRALRRATRVIGISKFTCEQVVKRQQVKAERISKLPCALNEELATIEPASVGPHQLVGKGSRVVLTVARLASSEQYKGHDVILRALPSVLQRVSDLTYVVVGDGDDRPRLEALAKELGLGQHVIFTGQVNDAELAALYRRCDVFAMPAQTKITPQEAKGEGFGIVYLEAMAFGKPVIGPNDGAPAEIIADGKHGLLVNPEDPSAVAAALVDMLTHPDRARAMGQAGSDWVRQQFSYVAFRERLKGILPEGLNACAS